MTPIRYSAWLLVLHWFAALVAACAGMWSQVKLLRTIRRLYPKQRDAIGSWASWRHPGHSWVVWHGALDSIEEPTFRRRLRAARRSYGVALFLAVLWFALGVASELRLLEVVLIGEW